MFSAHRNNSQRYKAPVDDSCEESSIFSSDLETTSVADSEDDRKSRFVSNIVDESKGIDWKRERYGLMRFTLEPCNFTSNIFQYFDLHAREKRTAMFIELWTFKNSYGV